MSYVQIVQRLPEEWRPAMLELVEVMGKDMREQLAVRRQDFDALTAVVQELAEAQKRTEQRLGRLEAVVQELAEAQKRTEQRVEELAEAQKRTEQRVEELAEAQIQTRKDLHAHLSAIGARWGMQTEDSFRTAIQAILGEFAGLRVERFTAYDAEGEVFGRPDQIEIDVLLRDGQTILGEIKASMSRGDVYLLARKVAFYECRQGVKVDRTIIITPMLHPRAQPVADALGIQVYTSAYDFGET